MKHLRAKCKTGFETSRQGATLSKRNALTIAPCPCLWKYTKVCFVTFGRSSACIAYIIPASPPADIYVALRKSTSWQDRWRQVKEQTWLDQASDIILNLIHLDTEDTLTWAVFMSSLLKNNRPIIKPNAIIGVMSDKTVSTPMVKQTMHIGKWVTVS